MLTDGSKKITSSPHVRHEDSTGIIMTDVLIALLPTAIMGIYNFGWRALVMILVCVICCSGSEFLYQYLTKQKITVLDCSAAVTGVLLALNLTPELPFWQAAIGSFFAIIIVKQIFGGLGQNIVNPALAARCFLILSFAKTMTVFSYDGVTMATPLALLKQGESVDLIRMFLGSTAGTIGETSTAAILVGAAYLVFRKVIDLRIPLCYLGTFTLLMIVYSFIGRGGFDSAYLLAQLCGGGLMLGAWFMATDYVTSPITPIGRIVYGCILGVLTFTLRSPWNASTAAEGVSYSILIGNLLAPLIERYTMHKAFGKGAEVHE